jgi:hypothetical protein
MKVQFNAPREIDGVNYSVGVHEVPDSLASHWYFMAIVANKVAVKVSDAAKVSEAKPTVRPKAPPKMRIEDAGKMAKEFAPKPVETAPEAPPAKEEKPEVSDEEKKAKMEASLAKRKATLEAKKAAAQA